MDLDAALEQFDATEANLVRLEAVWSELESLIPQGIAFMVGGPDGRRYDELSLAHQELVEALPAVSGYKVTATPMPLNAIAQNRFDLLELDELSATVAFDEALGQPGREIVEYRYRFEAARRNLVRDEVDRIVVAVRPILTDLAERFPAGTDHVIDPQWDALHEHVRQIERLAGGQIPRSRAWGDLQRHLRFGQGQDLHDIRTHDWPAVQSELRLNLYSELEALPVAVSDLGDVVRGRPRGVVTTALEWIQLDDEAFERLIFNIIAEADGYENPQWLTATRAPDRGRDLSVDHVQRDSLTGTTRERVIIQARHWLRRSVGIVDISLLLRQMSLWEPPPIRVLVVATSGRFTIDAVDWIDRHNTNNERPRIEMWASSHLELLLARRPHIVAAYRLRQST